MGVTDTDLRDVLPLGPEVHRADGEQSEVQEGSILRADQDRRKQLQHQQSEVAIFVRNKAQT